MGRTIKYGEIYDSDNFGQFIPIEYIGGPEDLVKIKFLNTGSERIVSSNALIHGKVKDLYMPIVAGVGSLGSFNGKVSDKDKIIFYKPWTCCTCCVYDVIYVFVYFYRITYILYTQLKVIIT